MDNDSIPSGTSFSSVLPAMTTATFFQRDRPLFPPVAQAFFPDRSVIRLFQSGFPPSSSDSGSSFLKRRSSLLPNSFCSRDLPFFSSSFLLMLLSCALTLLFRELILGRSFFSRAFSFDGKARFFFFGFLCAFFYSLRRYDVFFSGDQSRSFFFSKAIRFLR